MKQQLTMILFGLSFFCLVTSCKQTKEAEPIDFGVDQCSYCKMTISNPNFGAELITDKGRVLKYDATECMVNHLHEGEVKYQTLYAVPFNEPKQLKEVSELLFLITPEIRSPMGANLSAYSDMNQLDKKYHKHLMSWEELLARFNKVGL
ncbi:MAG: hypothetical protein KDC83_14185 [Flavobacteriales bacterium]|nr:hypothetical protein [Flavobacteriales bacterium]MCB0536901.1 hypothetical protein [Bacteroidota bacterium]